MVQGNTETHNGKTKRQARAKRPPKKITESYLHNSGLYYLERFAASSGHFRTVMMRKIDRSCMHHKEQSRDDCILLLDKLITKFQESGLLDDQGYTRAMVTSLRRRGHSQKMIRAKLAAKKLPQSTIGAELAKYDDDTPYDAELFAALKMAKKKRIGPFQNSLRQIEDEQKEHERNLARLARAGFSYEICRKIMDMDPDDPLINEVERV